MQHLPQSLQRLALEIDGWLDLGLPDRALERLPPLLENPAARTVALPLRTRALVELRQYREALDDLAALQELGHDREWIDLTEAWCRKRLDDLPGAIACMERLLARTHRSPVGHFNLACYLALSGQKERALEELSVACGLDPRFRDHLEEEQDLNALRDDPRFDALRPKGEE